MTQAAFEEYYRHALKELGFSLGLADALDDDIPAGIPDALRAWYRVAGRSRLNSAHNRILGPGELGHEGGKVVFAEENQEVVIWGFGVSENVDDPEVWQGQRDISAGCEWYSEELALSRFLVEMIRHTVVHERPIPWNAEPT